jgi:pre-rRNA-processing protein TSR1
MAKDSFSHRPTTKQKNKPFKSRHSTKGQLKTVTKGSDDHQNVIRSALNSNICLGKVETRVSITSAAKKVSSKNDRRNAAKLQQKKKRDEIMHMNRIFTGKNGAPKIIVI